MEEFTFTPQLGLIIGGLVGLLIGWVIGFFDSNNRTEKKIRAAEANAEIAIKEAEKKIAEASQQFAQSTATQDDPGLLRLKNEGGRYALEMDGTQISSALSADGKKRLIELLTAIRPYLEGGLPPQPAPAPVAPQQKTPPAAPPPAAKVSPPPAPAPSPAPVTDAPEVKKSDEEKISKTLSIVNQIDTVLQERLLKTSFAKRGIRLSESSFGGVEVYVGLEKFESIDDVPDAEIKAVIRAAIAEWEKRTTPGMN